MSRRKAPAPRPLTGEDREVAMLFLFIAAGFVMGLVFLLAIVASGKL